MNKIDKLDEIFTSFKKEKYILCLLIVIQILFAALFPFGLKQLIDLIVSNEDFDKLIFVSLFLTAITIINVLIESIQNYRWHILRHKAIKHLRSIIYMNMLSKKKSFFAKHTIGELITKMLDDANYCAQNIVIGVPMLVSNLLNIFVILTVLCVLEIRLAVIVLAFTPIYFYLFKHINKKIRAYSKRERNEFNSVTEFTQESIFGVEEIIGYRKQNFFISKFNKILDNHMSFVRKAQLYQSSGSSITIFIVSILPVVILIYGAWLINRGKMEVSSLIAFYTYLPYLYEPIRNLTDFNIGRQVAKGSSERILELLNEDMQEESDGLELEAFNTLSFTNLRFSYDEKRKVLDGLSFEINKGDIVGIVGESGTGKSTLLKLLTQNIVPFDSSIRINDIDICNYSAESLLKSMVYVTQNPFVFSGTIKENIAFNGDEVSKLNDALNISVLDEFYSDVTNKNMMISDFGRNISGGQKQRISISRAIYHSKKIIILDEPTSALDYDTSIKFMNLLVSYCKNNEITLLFVTHERSLLSYCNKVIDLDRM